MINKILKEFNKDKVTNILCLPNHERYQTYLSYVPNTHFYMWDNPKLKRKWHTEFAKIPSNYTFFKNLTPNIISKIDVILSQNKFGDWQTLSQMSNSTKIPMIQLEHTTTGGRFSDDQLVNCFNMRGHKNVFITEYSANEWGFFEDYDTVNHMVDSEVFAPKFSKFKFKSILSVVNDLKDRDAECGYTLWDDITDGLDTKLVGTCKYNLAKPAESTEHLVDIYQNHLIFLNTSLISPLPCSLLEAMSCGLCVVSAATCEIPNVIKNGENGFLFDPRNLDDAKLLINKLLDASPEFLVKIGMNARKTIEEKFSKKNFTESWERILNEVTMHGK